MKYVNMFIFISLLLTLNLSAITYEGGEDKKTNRWEKLNPSSSAIIQNVYDKSKFSRVIKFSGEGTKDAYILAINETKNKKLLRWEMKYSEDFVIFISLDTKLGKRYLIYTSARSNGYMKYGLGTRSISGTWQRFSRNLEEDLRYFDNRNSIVKINSFVIRGSGSLDNIKLMKDIKKTCTENIENIQRRILVEPIKKIPKKIKEKPLKIKKKPLAIKKIKKIKKKITKRTNTTPTITIDGENPLFLKLGEAYVEPGVSAEDKEDGEIIVTSCENINKHKEGEYTVIYTAIDSVGNAAADKRYVIVGNPTLKNEESEKSDEESNASSHKESSSKEDNKSKKTASSKDESEAQAKLEERELEISEWERELQFREKEISKREKNMEK